MDNLKRRRYKNIELIKNITLVVLFFSTILLLYFFWGSPIQKSFKISNLIGNDHIDIPQFESVIYPGRVVVHLGGGSYATVEDDEMNPWDEYLKSLKTLSREEILSIDEITEEQYDKIMEFRSVVFRFYYDLPYEVFNKKYDTIEFPGIEQIGEFSLLAFSSGSPESLFVYSSSKKRYYRIVINEPQQILDDTLGEIEAKKSPNYYRIGDLVGTENKTLIPIYKDSTTSEIDCTTEFEGTENADLKEFAQSFFGESLDFVRQIQDSKGTRIYMYGYGEKVLTIGANGKVEYKDKETPQGSQQNFLEALDTALQFVGSHGGWPDTESSYMNPYVLSVRQIEYNKQKGYRIIFGIKTSDRPIFLEGNNSLMLEVIHGQVTQYQRNIIKIDEEDYRKQAIGSAREAYSVINMIAQNYPYIAGILTENGHNFNYLEGEKLFDSVSNTIIFVKAGYVMTQSGDENKSKLVPAWIVNAGDILIYFDLYDASPLGHTVLFEA